MIVFLGVNHGYFRNMISTTPASPLFLTLYIRDVTTLSGACESGGAETRLLFEVRRHYRRTDRGLFPCPGQNIDID